jgi:phage replication O-like protein O
MSEIDGFAQLPNAMVKRLIELRIAGEEAQIFWVIFQKTIGWHKEKGDKIALSQFVKATGIIKQSVCQLINRLKKKNIILLDKDYFDVSNNGNFATKYRINLSYYQWQRVTKRQHTAAPSRHRNTGLELPEHWNVAQKMLFFKSFIKALVKIQMIVSNSTKGGGSKTPYDPLVKIRHSKEPNQNKLDTKDISSKESGAEVSQLIHFAARECKVTIMGEKVKILNKLVEIHTPERVKQAFENYKHYQGINRAGRRFPVGNGITSFVKKFDTFLDLQAVNQRIEDEKRWHKEQMGEGSKENEAQRKREERQGNEEEKRKQEEEERRNELASRMRHMRQFVKDIEAGAREKGVTEEEFILPDTNTMGWYNSFKRQLEELELEEYVDV